MVFTLGAVKNFANFTGKTLVLGSLFTKVSGPQAYKFIKKRLQNRCFHVKLKTYSRVLFLQNNSDEYNINEVIRAVLNSLLIFFLQKDFARTKKHENAQKAQKIQKAQKRNQAKVQNANKRTKIKNALKKHLSGKK